MPRDIRWVCLGLLLFLSSSSAPERLNLTTLGGTYWVCQTNAVDGGPAPTQAQAALNWLARFDGQWVQSGPCGAPGTPNYSFCPISERNGTPAGYMDVSLKCAGTDSRSPDGVTCPGQYFVSTEDGTGPTGGILVREVDVPAGIVTFERFYNSASAEISTLVTGWSHSFSRRIVASTRATTFQPYFGTDAHDSSLYSDPGTACTSGWGQIRAGSPQWSHTTSSYTNGVCLLSQNGAVATTLRVRNASAVPASVTGTPSSFDAVRDNGQRVSFAQQGTAIMPANGSSFRLSRLTDGYQLIDDQDITEIYDVTGKLRSVTTRAGIVVTLTYNSAAHLVTVENNQGDLLTLGYDSQGRLANVTDHKSHLVQYGYDAYSRLQRVTNPRGGSRNYVYEMSSLPYLLTGALDERGRRYATWKYDERGQVN
jgi:YD repeat-containing protein